MARPRTPTNVLNLRDSFKRNPNRKRPDEPVPATAFPKKAPSHLDTQERRCWREIAKLPPPGVLTGADTVAVEITAVLLAEFRRDRSLMNAQKLLRLTSLLGKLGLDPSGRASLVVPQPKSNPFDDV